MVASELFCCGAGGVGGVSTIGDDDESAGDAGGGGVSVTGAKSFCGAWRVAACGAVGAVLGNALGGAGGAISSEASLRGVGTALSGALLAFAVSGFTVLGFAGGGLAGALAGELIEKVDAGGAFVASLAFGALGVASDGAATWPAVESDCAGA